MNQGRPPRVASLLPAGTEIVAALGGLDQLVGISHHCDYPADVERLPRLTRSEVDRGQSSTAIDAQVRQLVETGRPVILIEGAALRHARPEVILTQDLCDVCAVVDGDVRSLVDAMSPSPNLVRLRGRSIEGIFGDIAAVGAAIERPTAATELISTLRGRLDRLSRSALDPRPRVICVEWLEPLYLAGHWVPELVQAAGGIDVGECPGAHSRPRRWEEVEALSPDLLVVALCGFGVERARDEWRRFLASEAGSIARRLGAAVHLIDGDAYTARPGPRIVTGAEILAAIVAQTRANQSLMRVTRPEAPNPGSA